MTLCTGRAWYRSRHADLDHAVEPVPQDLTVRTFRGLSYAEAPRFLGRDPAALDRFPEIAGDTGPIMVAASVTLPFKQGHWTEADYSPDFREFLDGLDRQPGLLGTHALSSVDEPGMLVILTWWKDKQALNGWFYSDVHQGYIHRVYGSRTPGAASPAPGVADPPGGRPRGGAEDRGQVGIDLCLPLPGGIHLGGGGLTPAEVFTAVNEGGL